MPKRPLGRAIRALGIESPRSPSLDNIEHILTRGQTRSEVSIKAGLEITALLRIGASTLRLAAPHEVPGPSVAEDTRTQAGPGPEARYYCEGRFPLYHRPKNYESWEGCRAS